MMKWRNIQTEYRSRLDELSKLGPHALLGLEPTATREQIRSAYRAKVKTYHPDVAHPFMRSYSQEVVKLLTNAYSSLMKDTANAN